MAKYKSKGAVLYCDSSNPPTTAVGQLGDFDVDFGERDALEDVTSHDNSSGTRDKLDVGLKQPLVLTGQLFWDPADTVHEDLRSVHATYAARNFKLVYPDTGAATKVWSGRVTSFSTPVPVAGKLMASIKVEALGVDTFAQ